MTIKPKIIIIQIMMMTGFNYMYKHEIPLHHHYLAMKIFLGIFFLFLLFVTTGMCNILLDKLFGRTHIFFYFGKKTCKCICGEKYSNKQERERDIHTQYISMARS